MRSGSVALAVSASSRRNVRTRSEPCHRAMSGGISLPTKQARTAAGFDVLGDGSVDISYQVGRIEERDVLRPGNPHNHTQAILPSQIQQPAWRDREGTESVRPHLT